MEILIIDIIVTVGLCAGLVYEKLKGNGRSTILGFSRFGAEAITLLLFVLTVVVWRALLMAKDDWSKPPTIMYGVAIYHSFLTVTMACIVVRIMRSRGAQ